MDSGIENLGAQNRPIVRILGAGGSSAVTGTASETQLAGITVPANVMGAKGALRIFTLWSYTNSGNTKTLRVRFGGAAGTAILQAATTTSGSFGDMRLLWNRNSASAQGVNAGGTWLNTNAALTTLAVDTALDTTVYISGQLANTGETITLEGYVVELIPGV